jgi:hypothetical protein
MLRRSYARAASAVLPAVGRVSSMLAASVASSAPWLRRRVRIGPLTAPLAALLAGASALAVLGALIAVLLFARRPTPETLAGEPAPSSSVADAPTGPRRDPALVRRAESGDEAALAELAALPERTLEETRALGRGRCQRGELLACMEAHRTGVQEYSALRKDPEVASDVRRAAVHDVAYEAAMRLAAHQLHESGLDVLWDTWKATRKDPALAAINRRARQFLDDTAVREHASRELGLVLDLERAERRKRCSEAKRLLARVIEYGDDRVLPLLDRLRVTRGCGLLDLQDCFGCLRGNKDLARAREAATGRPGPAFVVP